MQNTDLPRFNKAVGSTDVSAIVGSSPYAGKWEVYERLTKPQQDNDNSLLKMGRDMEPYLVNKVKTIDPRWLVLFGLPESAVDTFAVKEGVSRHDTKWGMETRSTSDGIVVENNDSDTPLISIEAKLVIFGDTSKWGDPLGDYDDWAGSGDALFSSKVPQHYYDQCQWHMLHDKTNVTVLPMLSGYSSDVRFYVVARDEERLTLLVSESAAFWARYIAGDEVPPPDASEAMTRHISEREARADLTKEADGEHVLLAMDYIEAKENYDAAKETLDKAKNILRLMVVEAGGDCLSFKNSDQVVGKITYKANKAGRKTLTPKVKLR